MHDAIIRVETGVVLTRSASLEHILYFDRDDFTITKGNHEESWTVGFEINLAYEWVVFHLCYS